ncbi:MAG: hypothetical protein Q9187_002078 [Circinaria calcarea]
MILMRFVLGLLEAWHLYRVPVLLISALCILFVWYRLRSRTRWEKLSCSPSAGTPNLTSVSEKTAWLEKPKARPLTVAGEINGSATYGDQAQVNGASLQPKRPRPAPKRVKGSRVGRSPQTSASLEDDLPVESVTIQPLVFFSSLTGSTERYAKKLVADFATSVQMKSGHILKPKLHDLSDIDYDDYFIAAPKPDTWSPNVEYFYLLIVPTYNVETILNTFLAHLKETHNDFRIDTAPMSSLLGYSVFGFGDREGWPTEQDGFCSQAREVDKWMAKLTGRKRAFPLGTGDLKSDGVKRLEEWRVGVEESIQGIIAQGGLGEGVLGSGEAVESDEEEAEREIDISSKNENNAIKPRLTSRHRRPPKGQNISDLEDLGLKSASHPPSALPIDFTTTSSSPPSLPEMVPASSPTHAALTKQGYSILGSHSGVKICRWTKSALRGRGSCYKYSFYGISSHLCMETTPSLSCSNKCVFCWRHGTNPVATTWRWKVDEPDLIFEGAKKEHLRRIKMMRGVPGVRAERFQEAMRIRHCALSLVGEPIFYPHINRLLALMHQEHISTFLVCNAQHPTQLAALEAVTQLYVSIDASNRESLRKIDRPLHRDFWERFLACLDIIREKRFRMRTVYRLTLVKGFNMDAEVDDYADLVARGLPCFVEIKGVTYCGTSTSSSAGLTMQNVPFYHEITAFVKGLNTALATRGLDYGIAAEHAHSCCVLMASKRFLRGAKWHTRIDYRRFFECLESGREFGPEDYVGEETPEWATWGRGGFDPRDERVDRKGRRIEGGGGQADGRERFPE